MGLYLSLGRSQVNHSSPERSWTIWPKNIIRIIILACLYNGASSFTRTATKILKISRGGAKDTLKINFVDEVVNISLAGSASDPDSNITLNEPLNEPLNELEESRSANATIHNEDETIANKTVEKEHELSNVALNLSELSESLNITIASPETNRSMLSQPKHTSNLSKKASNKVTMRELEKAKAAEAAEAARKRQDEIDKLISSYDIQIPINVGQSALVDKETGRIYWQSGGPSITSRDVFGPKSWLSTTHHVKAMVLSTLLWTCLITTLIVQRLWDYLYTLFTNRQALWTERSRPILTQMYTILISILLLIIKPKFRVITCNPVVITIIYAAYLYESFFCSTRRYFKNMVSQAEVQHVMETLREAKPKVIWTIRCYHYEETRKPKWKGTLQQQEAETLTVTRTKLSPPITTKGRKRVETHYASKQYDYGSWVDHSIVGFWNRAASFSPSLAPFTKISFAKMLVFANAKAREHYFSQQAQFISQEGRKDEHAEFATRIEVEGFKPKLLAARNRTDKSMQKIFGIGWFWLATVLGFTVPYRIWFSRHCDEIRVTLIKEVSTTSIPSIPPVSHDSSGLFSFNPLSWVVSRQSSAVEEATKALEERRQRFLKIMRELDLYTSSRAHDSQSNTDENELKEDVVIDKSEKELLTRQVIQLDQNVTKTI